jgi:hypothetical protein
MLRVRGEESGVSSDVHKPEADPHEEVLQGDPEEGRQRQTPVTELAEALAKVKRLEGYREQAERTSRLFASVTRYAAWVRENARRDSELALRKARTRVDKLTRTTSELERTESELAHAQDELAHAQDELARLQALTDETRAGLSAFLTAGLQALDNEPEDEAGESAPARGDLQETLQERLISASSPTPTPVTEVEHPQR